MNKMFIQRYTLMILVQLNLRFIL